MYLLVSATEEEMRPVRTRPDLPAETALLVAGVGAVETTLTLCRYLQETSAAITAVIDFGVAGAYPDSRAGLLDLCLARKEVFGDFGFCVGNEVNDFDWLDAKVHTEFSLDPDLLARAIRILGQGGFSPRCGTFVTVFCASGTAARGHGLRVRHAGLCENMEGAAVARVCQSFGLPCLELRAISNLVEDRDLARWQLTGAIERCAQAVGSLVAGLAAENRYPVVNKLSCP